MLTQVERVSTRQATSRQYGLAVLYTLTVLATVALWWFGTGRSGASSLYHGDPLWLAIGRLCGLLGANALIWQLRFIARPTWAERAFGLNRLTLWHRRNAYAMLTLLLFHPVALGIGNWSADLPSRFGAPTSRLSLLEWLPELVGVALLVLVLATSVLIVRRSLRYEYWYAIHLTSYLALLIALTHQFRYGADVTAGWLSQAYWVLLYLLPLSILLVFRIIVPLTGALRHRLRVSAVVRETPETVSLLLAESGVKKLDWKPGQFFFFRFLTPKRWLQAHPFSVSSEPGGQMRITVKSLGDFTQNLGDIPEGTPVLATGPYGVFTVEQARTEKLLCIAGGVGITPIRPLVSSAIRASVNVVLIVRARNAQSLLYREEFAELERVAPQLLRVEYIFDQNPGHQDPLSLVHLTSLVPDFRTRDAYLCGPSGLVQGVTHSLRQAGVPESHIHEEGFDF